MRNRQRMSWLRPSVGTCFQQVLAQPDDGWPRRLTSDQFVAMGGLDGCLVLLRAWVCPRDGALQTGVAALYPRTAPRVDVLLVQRYRASVRVTSGGAACFTK